jgi:hypothetical protein
VLEPVTVTGPAGETLTIVPRREPCRLGSDCLVVGFDTSGFATWPPTRTFTCEFSSGRQYTFRYAGRTAVETACATADVPDSITIIIDGVRSATVVNAG